MGSGASISVDEKELSEVPSMIDFDIFYQKVGDRLPDQEKRSLFEKCTSSSKIIIRILYDIKFSL